MFSPKTLVIIMIAGANEMLDYIGLLFEETLIWEVFSFLFNIVTFGVLFLLKAESLSVKQMFPNKKTVLMILVENIPIIGDAFPGFLGYTYYLLKQEPLSTKGARPKKS